MPPRLNRNANYSSNSKTTPAIEQDELDLIPCDPEPRTGGKQKNRSQRQLSEPPTEIAFNRVDSDSEPESAFGTPRRVRGEPDVDSQDPMLPNSTPGDKFRSPRLASHPCNESSNLVSTSGQPKPPPTKSASNSRAQRLPTSQIRPTPQILDAEESTNQPVQPTGHSRAPILSRDPTPLESLKKTVQSYLPSTNTFSAPPFTPSPLPTQHQYMARSQKYPSGTLRSSTPGSPSRVAPAPPLVSRPVVSFGRPGASPISSREDALYNLGHPTSITQDAHDTILWSRFDQVQDRKYLLLGYAHGVQIWCYNDLGKLDEVLNIPDVSVLSGALSGDEYAKYAGFLPHILGEDAPFLGFILSSFFTIYSLARSQVVKCMMELPGADRFESNTKYILLSTTNPARLHIISTETFQSLHSISTSSLTTVVSPPALNYPQNHESGLGYAPLAENSAFGAYLAHPSPPHPVFALNGRLLAYLSPPPPTPPVDKANKRWSSGAANIGGKLGGAVLNGMRFALTAATQAGSTSSGGRYFSKSAPAGESDDGGWPSASPTSLSPFSTDHPSHEEGQYIVVMDIMHMRKISGFHVASDVTALSFSRDGTRLAVTTKDATTFSVYSLRSLKHPHHEYDLKRGRTAAVVDHSGVEWTSDGLWLGASTRNRTLHIFPINPYGGKIDTWSHLQGRVRDSDNLVHKGAANTIQVHPLTRIRASNRASREQLSSPLAFTFLASTQDKPSLRSPPNVQSSNSQKGSHRDVLVFDPVESKLTLHRLFVNRKPARGTNSPTSASLPSNMLSNLSAMMEGSDQELTAKETTVASWSEVQRKAGWEECKWVPQKPSPKTAITTDWMSQAELTTSQRQRSIYLSHQLSFHALGEDYHALIRTRQFNIPATKITVQREVHPIASTENLTMGQHGHQAPLNEALSVGMDHTPPIATIPMYPNGTPHSWTRSSSMSLGSIPIKSVTEGVSEGLGRIRREISKARSPILPAAMAKERLEFDEHDDDFDLGDGQSRPSNHLVDEGEVFVLDHEPVPPPPATEEDGHEWEPAEEAQRVVDEVERFDNITVVGFFEEEQEERIRAENEKSVMSLHEERGAPKKGRKKNKKK